MFGWFLLHKRCSRQNPLRKSGVQRRRLLQCDRIEMNDGIEEKKMSHIRLQ